MMFSWMLTLLLLPLIAPFLLAEANGSATTTNIIGQVFMREPNDQTAIGECAITITKQ